MNQNILNPIMLNNHTLPQILETGYCCASEPFYHVNRTAPFHVLIFVVEGVIYVTEDNVDYAIKPGQLFFLKAGINHYGKSEIPQKTKWYYAHFLLEEENSSEGFKWDFDGDFTGNYPVHPALPLQKAVPKMLSGLMGSDCEKDIADIVNDFHSSNSEILWYTNLQLFKFLCKLTEIERGKLQKKKSLADRITDYLDEHYSEEFDLKKMEDLFCLSYKRMAAVFKDVKGISMLKYCMERRIQQACKLLQLTDMNIGEIAGKVGYEDQLYFTRIFKQFKNISPKEWRKEAFRKYSV